MSDSIRDMVNKAKLWKVSAIIYANHKRYRAWPNGHVRIDGVHYGIAAAEQHLERSRAVELAAKVGLS